MLEHIHKNIQQVISNLQVDLNRKISNFDLKLKQLTDKNEIFNLCNLYMSKNDIVRINENLNAIFNETEDYEQYKKNLGENSEYIVYFFDEHNKYMFECNNIKDDCINRCRDIINMYNNKIQDLSNSVAIKTSNVPRKQHNQEEIMETEENTATQERVNENTNTTTDIITPQTILEFAKMLTDTVTSNNTNHNESNITIKLHESSISQDKKKFEKYIHTVVKKHRYLDIKEIPNYVKILYSRKDIDYIHPLHFTNMLSLDAAFTLLPLFRERKVNDILCKLRATLSLHQEEEKGSSTLLNHKTTVNETALKLYHALRRCLLDFLYTDPGARSIIKKIRATKQQYVGVIKNSSPVLMNALITNCIYYDTDMISTIATIIMDTLDAIQKHVRVRDIFDIAVIGLITGVEQLRQRWVNSTDFSEGTRRDTMVMAIHILELVFGRLVLQAPSTSLWKTHRICYQLPFLSVMIECVDKFFIVASHRALHLRRILNDYRLSGKKIHHIQSRQETLYDYESLDKLLVNMIQITRNVREAFLAVFHNIFLLLCSYAGDSNLDIGDDKQYSTILGKNEDIKTVLPSQVSIADMIDSKQILYVNTTATDIFRRIIDSMTANVPSVFLKTPEFRSTITYGEVSLSCGNGMENLSNVPTLDNIERSGMFRSLFISNIITQMTTDITNSPNQRLLVTHLATIPTSPISIEFNDIVSGSPPINSSSSLVGSNVNETINLSSSSFQYDHHPLIQIELIANHVTLSLTNIGDVCTLEKLFKVRDRVKEILKKPVNVLAPGTPVSIPRDINKKSKFATSSGNDRRRHLLKSSKTSSSLARKDNYNNSLIQEPRNARSTSNVNTTEMLVVPSIINPLFIQTTLTNNHDEHGSTRRIKTGALKSVNESCGCLFYI